jgi:hypothetical protein
MKNFDTDNIVNPRLVERAIILYQEEIYEVIDMNLTKITIRNKNSGSLEISDDAWNPIPLTKDWLDEFNLQAGSKIRNVITNLDWTIKKAGIYYYLTIHKDPSFGDNPVVGIKFVHELQEWFYRLTHTSLRKFRI